MQRDLNLAANEGDWMGEVSECLARTYDAIAPTWTQWADAVSPPLRERYANALVERLPSKSPVLEIGCGSGVPVAALLAHHFDLNGIDISHQMVRLAQAAVPAGNFKVGDIFDADYGEASFNGIVGFYSLIHLPRETQITLFSRIHLWLRPGGLFVASLGASDVGESVEENWLGAGTMFWSSYDARTNLGFLGRAGFDIEHASVIRQVEPSGDEVAFLWLIARKDS
jgi:SAM-dependent methyltransferase